jgi:4'-phosphopantetheinyl transferase
MSALLPASDEVQVWRATLSVADAELARLAALLSADERRRATRYLVPSVRRRFTVCRGILRTLLGGYLGIDAIDIDLEYGHAGKPRLAAAHDSDLMFNLAHSRDLAVFAFCRRTEIGVDVEEVDHALDTAAIVSTMFSAGERDRYLALPETEQRLAFYLAWTRKEAFLKGEGCGMTGSLAEVDVTGVVGPRRLAVAGRASEPGWTVEDLPFDAGWVGAVAVQRAGWQLKMSRWDRFDGYGDAHRTSGLEGGKPWHARDVAARPARNERGAARAARGCSGWSFTKAVPADSGYLRKERAYV